MIPDAIFVSKNAFFGGLMAGGTNRELPDSKIYLEAVHACAEVIVKCYTLEPNGFANLQFAALANVRAGAPFLPAAYHEGDEPAFGIATEAADLAVQAFESAQSLEEGRNNLVNEIEKHGRKLTKIAGKLNNKFGGIDFSLAPFPDDAHSLGNAVEKMGVPQIGQHGSLAAAAILTEAIERADFPHTGFSGFMQPVMEDSVLAMRAADLQVLACGDVEKHAAEVINSALGIEDDLIPRVNPDDPALLMSDPILHFTLPAPMQCLAYAVLPSIHDFLENEIEPTEPP